MGDSRSAPIRRCVLFGAAFLLAGSAWAAPASAHTGSPAFEVLSPSRQSGSRVELLIEVTFSLDGDPAEGAFLYAVPVSPKGRRLQEIELSRRPGGRYRAAIPVAGRGRWTFEITSTFPPGSTRVTVDVEPAAERRLVWVAVAALVVVLVGVAATVALRRNRHGPRA